jgi:hypothetical protein
VLPSDADEEAAMQEIERWAGHPLPSAYRHVLPRLRDEIIGEQVLLYPADMVVERNETYQTKKYCPGYITIGDDSGGRAVMIALDDPTSQIYIVGHGSMDPQEFEPVNLPLAEWLEAACPVD